MSVMLRIIWAVKANEDLPKNTEEKNCQQVEEKKHANPIKQGEGKKY